MWPSTETIASAAAMIAMETATCLSNGSLACSTPSLNSSFTDMSFKIALSGDGLAPGTMEDPMRNPSPPLSVVLLFAFTIFLSSFLLFMIQPVFAKLILPWFGGAAGVWITCLVFFQVALLLGYLYAHFVADHLGPRVQTLLHIGLLAASLLLLPVIPGPSWKSAAT